MDLTIGHNAFRGKPDSIAGDKLYVSVNGKITLSRHH